MSAEPKIETRMIASTQPLAKAASGICNMAPGVALCCAIAVAAAAIATVAGTSVTWALDGNVRRKLFVLLSDLTSGGGLSFLIPLSSTI